jgi:hypothetical protein
MAAHQARTLVIQQILFNNEPHVALPHKKSNTHVLLLKPILYDKITYN